MGTAGEFNTQCLISNIRQSLACNSNLAIAYLKDIHPGGKGSVADGFIGDSLYEVAQPGRQHPSVYDKVSNVEPDVSVGNVGVSFNQEVRSQQPETDQVPTQANLAVEEVNLRVGELSSLSVDGHIRGQLGVCRAYLEGAARIIEDC